MMDEKLRCEPKLEKIKNGTKQWVKEMIPTKSIIKETNMNFSRKMTKPPNPGPTNPGPFPAPFPGPPPGPPTGPPPGPPPDPPPGPAVDRCSIRRYFQPISRATSNDHPPNSALKQTNISQYFPQLQARKRSTAQE